MATVRLVAAGRGGYNISVSVPEMERDRPVFHVWGAIVENTMAGMVRSNLIHISLYTCYSQWYTDVQSTCKLKNGRCLDIY